MAAGPQDPRWKRPCLTTLARSAPQEAVLEYCKLFTPYGGEGVNSDNSGCWVTTCNTACLAHSMAS